MPKPKTITLSLTEQESRVVRFSLYCKMRSCEESIQAGADFPESAQLAAWAAEAEAELSVLHQLSQKILGLCADAGFRL